MRLLVAVICCSIQNIRNNQSNMNRNALKLSSVTSVLMLLAISYYHGVAGQKFGLSVPPDYQGVAGQKFGLSVPPPKSREGKTLTNTFPFSEQTGHHHHHHSNEDVTSNTRSSHGSSLPRQGLIPPQSENRISRLRGAESDDDLSLDIGSIAAAGERCIDKVVMVEETEYDDVITCKHSYSEKCHITYATAFSPQQEEDCEESFVKNCFIEFKNKASQEQVQFCITPLVKNCDTPGPTECTTEYQSACVTRYHEHDVEDDVVDCIDEVEEKCESKTQGYSTTEECTKWPVRKCSVEKKNAKKYSPVTECKKVPFELCGPGACPVEPGPEECQERTQTVVIEVPEETCNLEPQRICKHVTKLVPHLKAKENCIDIPKEVCSRSRTNPRKVEKPIVKKWCYTSVTPTRPPPPRPAQEGCKRGANGRCINDSNIGNAEPITERNEGDEKTKRCKQVTNGRCDLRKKIIDGKINTKAVNCDPECHKQECGYTGGECDRPKDTYLPPKEGY